MKKWISKIVDNWWIVLICLLVVFILLVSIINNSNINRFTTDFLHNLNQIIAPLGVILGLVLGYPLLRKKLVEGYITKQFDIIHENNRIVRKECLRLKEKYPFKHISQNLTKEYLKEALDDVKRLNELAIDANQDAYKYSYLLYVSLLKFNEKTPDNIPQEFHEIYYNEALSGFIQLHLNEVYKYSRSIGFVPSAHKIIEKPIITPKLKKFVTDNTLYQIESLDSSLSYKHASAMLVTFFAINNTKLSKSNGLLLKCCYLSAPTPSPFARILFDRNIYMPLVIEEKNRDFFNTQLVLIKFDTNEIRNADTGEVRYEVFCYYSNISSIGFVKGTIKSKYDLNKYKDVYLEDAPFDFSVVEDFTIHGENIMFKIKTDIAQKHFIDNKKKLQKRILKEL